VVNKIWSTFGKVIKHQGAYFFVTIVFQYQTLL